LRNTPDQRASRPLRSQNKLLKLAQSTGEVLERYPHHLAGNGMRALTKTMTVPAPPTAT
jgi:hypothetical protein